MSPEIITVVSAIRAVAPELVGLINDLGTLANGGEISTERLESLKQRGNELDASLDDLIAQRQEEES